MAVNTIAENLLSQVDEEIHCQLIMKEMIDHWINDEDITIENSSYCTKPSQKQRKRTTRGWEMYVE